MKTLSFGVIALFLLAGLLLVEGASSSGGQALKVRQPAVAGTFYPADPKELAKMIDDFLAKAAHRRRSKMWWRWWRRTRAINIRVRWPRTHMHC
jgi:hypothetical protein